MTGNKIESIHNIKSEIIQELLFKYVQELSKKYKKYLKVNDGSIKENDCEMSIYLDTIYRIEDFHDKNMYGLYLKDYELKCKEFIMELDKKLPLNHLTFTEFFHDEDELDGEYYFCCELQFKIKNLEVYYY